MNAAVAFETIRPASRDLSHRRAESEHPTSAPDCSHCNSVMASKRFLPEKALTVLELEPGEHHWIIMTPSGESDGQRLCYEPLDCSADSYSSYVLAWQAGTSELIERQLANLKAPPAEQASHTSVAG